MGSEIANINEDGTRLEKLKALADILATAIDGVKYQKDLPPLVKQYREVIREIEEIEGTETEDGIEEIIKQRKADGKPGAVRKGRAEV